MGSLLFICYVGEGHIENLQFPLSVSNFLHFDATHTHMFTRY